jgi:hypothetical protein
VSKRERQEGPFSPHLPALPPAPASAIPAALPPALPDPPVTPLAVPTSPVASALGTLLGRMQRRYRLLLFKPRTFFAGMTAPRDRNELFFLAFAAGLATAIGNSEATLLADPKSVNGHNWGLYWLYLIGQGALYGIVIYWLGAAWYRFRLRLAGVKATDIWVVRRIYLSAAMVLAVPIILKALIFTCVHDTPLAAALADPTWQTRVYAFFPLWSTVVGYIGVRTVFKPRGPGTPILFLILPGLFYLLLAIVMFGRGSGGTALAEGPVSDIAHPKTFASETMSFSYPANWSVMKGDKDYDPQRNVTVRPVQDARIIIFHLTPSGEMTCRVFAERVLEAIQNTFGALASPSSFEVWGGFKGIGERFEGLFEGRAYVVRIFVAPVTEKTWLYILETSLKADDDRVLPGFELIRKTFRMTS